MSIDKIDPVFAESGVLDLDVVFDTMAPTGFVDQRVRFGTLNKAINRQDTRINELLDKGPKGFNPSAGLDTILTRIYSPADAGTFAYDPQNVLDSGHSSDEFVDVALAVVGGVRKAVCCEYTTPLTLEIFDLDAMAYEGAETVSASSLPQDSGNEDWRPAAVICDADTAYVLWQDNGATSTYHYDHYVQAYNLSDWTVKTGWPTTGLFLFDPGAMTSKGKMIFATSGLLAVLNDQVTITGGSDAAVVLVDVTDGTVDSSGAGDLSSSAGAQISSNGTYVFISTATHIGSMTIASPATGCGGTGWPRAVAGDEGLCCLGNVVAGTNGSYVYLLSTANANIATVDATTDATVVSDLGPIVTDGLYFWARGRRTVGATARECFVYRLKLGGLMQENSTTPDAVDAGDGIFECFAVSVAEGDTTGKMIFDGDGIVGVLDPTGDGRLWKLPKALLR